VGKKKLKCLDALLEPFIRDLQELYVDGIDVFYNYPVELVDSTQESTDKWCKVTVLVGVFTGDHLAQCKFGGWNLTGHAACRNCKMSSRWCKHKVNAAGRGNNQTQHQSLMGRAVYDNN
jgi:hypothetical protein